MTRAITPYRDRSVVDPRRAALALKHEETRALINHPVMLGSGDDVRWRAVAFFEASIANDNTRRAYGRAVAEFLDWCQGSRRLSLDAVTPLDVAGFTKALAMPEVSAAGSKAGRPRAGDGRSKVTVKLKLAALRRFFNFLQEGGLIGENPATPVRGPKFKVKKGKTPILTGDQAGVLMASIETDTITGLRDRARIARTLQFAQHRRHPLGFR